MNDDTLTVAPPDRRITAPLDGRVVALTGSARGLGLQITEALLAQGAQVIANYRSMSRELQELGRVNGERLRLLPGDVTSEETAESLVVEARRLGRLDVLIHNAGITRDQPLVRMPVEDWDEVHRVNLRGAFLSTKHALKLMMRARYGRIIYVSSVTALTGNTGQAAYTSSKSGLHGLALSVSQEYASYNVRTATVAPGILDTGLGSVVAPAQRRRMEDRSLLGLGPADQTAATVAFLASPAADYINATVIRTDGGMRY
ncbi:3-oxoacyl-[acyl-carrier protein] reductase [Streptomyces zhaozhouensis]|uniref:3-oxoacyl-[acyl-carrier protein] reductase n=1 Tax=Streptomyces zhaozhouensis TaxID=1300267 RepID=A0A286DP09_9ACTN|nr:SDR family oxidoreductase [Streptomyces zhaozhouensis]SOD60425.1 3-oxoacyl-[acyl-carrier protein] reductase [Streptomyces zhaozhouensis]